MLKSAQHFQVAGNSTNTIVQACHAQPAFISELPGVGLQSGASDRHRYIPREQHLIYTNLDTVCWIIIKYLSASIQRLQTTQTYSASIQHGASIQVLYSTLPERSGPGPDPGSGPPSAWLQRFTWAPCLRRGATMLLLQRFSWAPCLSASVWELWPRQRLATALFLSALPEERCFSALPEHFVWALLSERFNPASSWLQRFHKCLHTALP